MPKRALDMTVALVGLILLSPLMVLIAVLVRLDSPGPVFYRAPRVGKDGQLFRMFKFRTMVIDADRIGPAITLDKDPRITRVGARLRKSRLDEIPQLQPGWGLAYARAVWMRSLSCSTCSKVI